MYAWIIGLTMCDGLTFRKRIPKSVAKEMRTPEASAVTQRPIGMKRKKRLRKISPMTTKARMIPRFSVSSTSRSLLEGYAPARTMCR